MGKRFHGVLWIILAIAVLASVAAVAGEKQNGGCAPPGAVAPEAAETVFSAEPPSKAAPRTAAEVMAAPTVYSERTMAIPTVSNGMVKAPPVRPPEESVTFAPELAVVLWDQPLSTVNQAAYVDQDFPDFPVFSSYLADDFTNPVHWSIEKIFVPGDGWNGFASLMAATSLTWAIYPDAGGVPSGFPGGGAPPLWTLTLPPVDPQVALTIGSGGMPSNTLLTLSVPVALPPGHWWLYFYPTMPFAPFGQFGRQAADTANGFTGQFINPGGGFGFGPGFLPWTILGPAQPDLAFRLEGSLCSGGTISGTYDNGPLVTHPGGGSGGADASALQTALGMSTYGYGHQFSVGYRVADDFVVTDPAGWDISTIQFYAYQTGSTTTSTITGVYYQIWNGIPSNPASTVVFGDTTTNRMTNTTWANIYRVLDTGLTGTSRPVMVNTVSCGTHLAPGTYWLDWMTDGTLGSGPWASPISILGQTTTGNAIQWTGAWNPLTDVGTQGFPFKVNWSVCITCPVITLSPTTLPLPILGVPYTQTITAAGGTGPYTYAVTAGALPAGFTLSAGGVLTGTLTALGDYSFTVTATDSLGCTGAQAYTIGTFSTYFLDDAGRAKLCVNRLTGAYTWEILMPPGVGVYTGVARILNGGTKIYSQPGAPDYLNCTYDPLRKRASGYYMTAAGDYSRLVDYNTTNNVGGCP